MGSEDGDRPDGQPGMYDWARVEAPPGALDDTPPAGVEITPRRRRPPRGPSLAQQLRNERHRAQRFWDPALIATVPVAYLYHVITYDIRTWQLRTYYAIASSIAGVGVLAVMWAIKRTFSITWLWFVRRRRRRGKPLATAVVRRVEDFGQRWPGTLAVLVLILGIVSLVVSL